MSKKKRYYFTEVNIMYRYVDRNKKLKKYVDFITDNLTLEYDYLKIAFKEFLKENELNPNKETLKDIKEIFEMLDKYRKADSFTVINHILHNICSNHPYDEMDEK